MKQKKNNSVKSNKLPRFGLLDIFIILLVIVTIVCIYFRHDMLAFFTNQRNSEQYTVTFSIQNIRYTTPNYIEIGDTVYFKSDGKVLGTVMSASDEMSNLALNNITPASKTVINDAGQPIEIFYPNNEIRVDGKGRLSCFGKTSDKGAVLINGSTYIAPGQELNVYTEEVSVTIQILSIEKTT